MLNEKQKDLLDRTVAFAKANGITHTTGNYYDSRINPTCACAVGATSLMLACDIAKTVRLMRKEYDLDTSDVIYANDYYSTVKSASGASEEYGVAYRKAMTK